MIIPGASANSISLPFADDTDCGLGIAVRTYLDELAGHPDSTSPKVRSDMKARSKGYFSYIDSMDENLDLAFKLWDAVRIESTTHLFSL